MYTYLKLRPLTKVDRKVRVPEFNPNPESSIILVGLLEKNVTKDLNRQNNALERLQNSNSEKSRRIQTKNKNVSLRSIYNMNIRTIGESDSRMCCLGRCIFTGPIPPNQLVCIFIDYNNLLPLLTSQTETFRLHIHRL